MVIKVSLRTHPPVSQLFGTLRCYPLSRVALGSQLTLCAVAFSLINEVTTAHVSLGGCATRQNVGPWGMPGTRGAVAHSRFHLHKRSSGGTVGEGGGCSPDWPHPASQTPALPLSSLFRRPPKEAREGPITGAQTRYNQVQTSLLLISVMGDGCFLFIFYFSGFSNFAFMAGFSWVV